MDQIKRNPVIPIFIFSLPRSGSTLLQRLLTCNESIDSTSETWLLLPMLYSLKRKGVYAEYSHQALYEAVDDFIGELPGGKGDYLKAIDIAARYLYGQCSSSSAKYFIDKTPRYSLVCDDVISTFEDGVFIFLWRNPLSIISSMIETWGAGSWNIFKFKVDIYDGLEKMLAVYTADKEKYISVKYEELIEGAEAVVRDIIDLLDGVAYESSSLDRLSEIKFSGRMGDPTGAKKYQRVSNDSKDSWKKTINTPIRKFMALNYLKWIGKDRLGVMGYDYDVLVGEVKSVKNKYLKVFPDSLMILYGFIYSLCEPIIIRDKFRRITNWKMIRRHK